jgi:hypothetical protein
MSTRVTSPYLEVHVTCHNAVGLSRTVPGRVYDLIATPGVDRVAVPSDVFGFTNAWTFPHALPPSVKVGLGIHRAGIAVVVEERQLDVGVWYLDEVTLVHPEDDPDEWYVVERLGLGRVNRQRNSDGTEDFARGYMMALHTLFPRNTYVLMDPAGNPRACI